MKALDGSIRRFSEVAIRTEGFYGDAIDRADARALVAADAIIGFHVQAIASGIRNRNLLFRILDGDGASFLIEIAILIDAKRCRAVIAFQKMLA